MTTNPLLRELMLSMELGAFATTSGSRLVGMKGTVRPASTEAGPVRAPRVRGSYFGEVNRMALAAAVLRTRREDETVLRTLAVDHCSAAKAAGP